MTTEQFLWHAWGLVIGWFVGWQWSEMKKPKPIMVQTNIIVRRDPEVLGVE
jgi:hypothetical protein